MKSDRLRHIQQPQPMLFQHIKPHLGCGDINMGLHNQNMHIKWLDDDLFKEYTQEFTFEQREKEKEKESVVVTTHDKQLIHVHDHRCKHFPSYALATSLTRKKDNVFLPILIGKSAIEGLLYRYMAAHLRSWRWCQQRNVVKGKNTSVFAASPLVRPLFSSLPSHPLHASPPLIYLSVYPNYSYTFPTFTRYK